MILALALLLFVIAGWPSRGTATSVVAVPTATLAEEATAIVVGHVTRIRSFWDRGHGQVFTLITLQVSEVIKGTVPEAQLTIKQVGGVVGDLESWVFGSPQFARGEKVLLFLERSADGSPRVSHLYQGKWSVLADPVDGEEFVHRDSRADGVHVIGGAELPSHYDLYRLRDFTGWLQAVLAAGGSHAQPQAGPVISAAAMSDVVEEHADFTLMNPSAPARWSEPDNGAAVTMRINSLGQAGASTLGFDQIRAAFQAWSTVAGSSFRYAEGSTTSAVGFQGDGINAISFGDPLDQMSAPAGCSGTLAIGGYIRSGSQTSVASGQTFYRILEGDLVFNGGWAGCGFYESFANFAEVATHELGHVAGLGHSATTSATMYFSAHFDGRGASLQPDDVAGIQFIYPATGPVTTPDIRVAPTSVSFGSAVVGSSSAASTVTVTNQGTANLVVGSLSVGGANAADFLKPSASDLCSTKTLSPGQSCTVGVQFKPGSAGTKSALLVVPSNDPDTSQASVGLSGTGSTGAGAVPDIRVAPASLSFGNVALGSSSGTSTVTVTNQGTANLVLGSLSLGGANVSDFRRPLASDLCSARTLGPGKSCTVGVKFKPNSAGTKSALLVVPSNDPDTSQATVALSGTGGSGTTATPDIRVAPTSVSFGSAVVGSSSAASTVTVTNQGTGNLVVGSLSVGGANAADFLKPSASDLCSAKTLSPGQSCTVGVQFKPGSAGTKSALLLLPSNDPDTSQASVGLSGTGSTGAGAVPDIRVTPASLSFGSVVLGSSSGTSTVTVTNQGTASLVLGSLSLGGASAGDFRKPATSDLCSARTLGAGQSCTVGVKFKPGSHGAKSAVLQVPSNDPDQPSLSVTLSGTAR